MSAGEEDMEVRNRKPKDSKFRQQALPAWQPILTAGTVLPTFFVIGVAFIPIGVGLIYFSNQVHEITYNYTECVDTTTSNPCSTMLDGDKDANCTCVINLKNEDFGEEEWKGNVYIYYGLTNFYQNHRRYVKSRDDKQLFGDLSSKSDQCDPFLKPDNKSEFYAPCGAIANSMFNDIITLEFKREGEAENEFSPVQVSRYDIAWKSDREQKFRNPDVPDGKSLEDVFKEAGAVRPRDWRQDVWELDTERASNNGFQNEDLIVWMRAAALPNFRKLYRRVDHTNELGKPEFNTDFRDGLPVKGYNYRLKIDYRFRVAKFQGTKSVIISTTSLLGGRNPFLGIAYIVVGCICFLLGIVFLFIHLRYGRTTQEMMNISPRTPYS